MKRNNKKGFTIVELVIVIAVIAILSAVLIPTFGGIVDKAQASKAQQEVKNIHTLYIADIDYAHGETAETIYVKHGDKYYSVTAEGKITEASLPATGYVADTVEGVAANTVYVACKNHVDSDAAQDATSGTCDYCGETFTID